jgi:hypothetical protein
MKMTTKRIIIFESFVIFGSFDCDHTHDILIILVYTFLIGKGNHHHFNEVEKTIKKPIKICGDHMATF